MTKTFFISSLLIIILLMSSVLPNYSGEAARTKPPFVNIVHEIPDAYIDIRYATNNNFMGTILHGYRKGYCWVRQKTAQALKKAQIRFGKMGYSLRFFDCYRPLKAVSHMIEWTKTHRPEWLGVYIGRKIDLTVKYGHSCGNTVDVSLVERKTGKPVDMGTDFDDFRREAWTAHAGGEVLRNRMILLNVLTGLGFQNFYSEWWHYTYQREPAPPLDIDIE